jgi:hypothetical protein
MRAVAHPVGQRRASADAGLTGQDRHPCHPCRRSVPAAALAPRPLRPVEIRSAPEDAVDFGRRELVPGQYGLSIRGPTRFAASPGQPDRASRRGSQRPRKASRMISS